MPGRKRVHPEEVDRQGPDVPGSARELAGLHRCRRCREVEVLDEEEEEEEQDSSEHEDEDGEEPAEASRRWREGGGAWARVSETLLQAPARKRAKKGGRKASVGSLLGACQLPPCPARLWAPH